MPPSMSRHLVLFGKSVICLYITLNFAGKNNAYLVSSCLSARLTGMNVPRCFWTALVKTGHMLTCELSIRHGPCFLAICRMWSRSRKFISRTVTGLGDVPGFGIIFGTLCASSTEKNFDGFPFRTVDGNQSSMYNSIFGVSIF